mmetsp:Transcript_58710/g.109932  ORF Transcript_58710/g.109932 Transcript_58710/m.109932 type:complete len:269 (-) Transcript_58710:62-868(-)
MGAKKKEKQAAQAQTAPAAGFRLPEPDRTLQLSVPPVAPPVDYEDAVEAAEDSTLASLANGLPRKVQLQHLSLLTHPVRISAIDNFLTEEECLGWITWGERKGFEEAKQKANSVYAHRDNGRIEFNSPDIAYLLWLRIKGFVPEAIGPRKALGCSPRIRVYRYVKGQRFGQHVDGSRDEPEMGGRTHFTVLVYLNGGDRDAKDFQVKGGETVFWKDHDGKRPALAFPPTRGVCLFHGHGDECMTHEGAGVEEGVKYVLRTDVVYELEK